jgi:hypothetical protein
MPVIFSKIPLFRQAFRHYDASAEADAAASQLRLAAAAFDITVWPYQFRLSADECAYGAISVTG